MRKELLLFSLPLFGTIFMGRLMKWTDVLMLGHFTTADMVGLYNGAIPISELMPVFLSSSGFISIPVLSSLYSREKFSEMKKTYSIITKWIFSATFPMFLIVFLFPRVVLTFFFGPDYQDASTALRILATGYMFHALMGPNALNLVIFGRANLTMANTTAGLFINVLLNVLLIPLYGINGAAAATAVTYISVNTLSSLEVYIIQRMHPFSRNYVKPLLSSLGLLLLFRILFTYQFDVRYWMLPFLFVLFIIIYCFIILISKSFDREDIMLLKAIESRTGLNISWLRKILRRFL
jgi:O-antigen/teichoic acid export membrane protein